MVGNFDNGLGGSAVDQLDAEDVGIREVNGDVGLQLAGGRAAGVIGEGLCRGGQSASDGARELGCWDEAASGSSSPDRGDGLTDAASAKTEATRRARAARTEYLRPIILGRGGRSTGEYREGDTWGGQKGVAASK